MRAAFAFILVSLILAACGGSEEPQKRSKPEDVISKDSMAIHLSELHRLEAIVRNREIRNEGYQSNAKYGLVDYFDTCGTSKKRFVKSLDFWKDDVNDMNAIYDEAMEILSTRMAKIKSESAAKEVAEREMEELERRKAKELTIEERKAMRDKRREEEKELKRKQDQKERAKQNPSPSIQDKTPPQKDPTNP